MLGVVLNFGFVVVGVIAGIVGNSTALLADAAHNLGDVLGLAMAWGAMVLARRGRTARRTYGLRRGTILAALANAMLLLVAVGGVTWESIQRLGRPLAVDGGLVAAVAVLGVIINTSSALLFLRGRKGDVNVRGAFNLCKAFLPSMLERKAGNIINLASIGGVVGIKDRLAYCTTKFAMVGLTKCLALDHAKDGVRVNCICPGRVETPFVSARLKEYPDPEQAYREMASTQAIGRMGRPEEIAAAALYLASDEAAFVTGTAHLTDGGWSAGYIAG